MHKANQDEDFSMSDFDDLESLYTHLEQHAFDYKYPHQIAGLFRGVRDLKHKESDSNEVEKAQWEVDFFNFVLKDGEIWPTFTRTNDKGEVVEYPSLERFNDKAYNYLGDRLSNTSHPLLKARYSHILWCSPKKHGKYGKLAVESYLGLIKQHENKGSEGPKEDHGLEIINVAKNAYALSRQANYKINEVKSELARLVKEYNFDSRSSAALRIDLIRLMLQEKRRFSNEYFEDLDSVCWQVSESLAKNGNTHGAIRMLELGERVDQRLGKQTHDWRKRIAECHEQLMVEAEDRDNLACLTFCQQAIDSYKKTKDKRKIKELETKYAELKSSMKLGRIKTEIDLSDHVQKCREMAREIAQNPSQEIVKLLMLDKNLLPRYDDLEKIAEEHREKFILQHLVPTEIIDQSGHAAQHFSDEEEKKYYNILWQYELELRLNKLLLINEIFFAAIRENKLTMQILLEFLRQHSWFGKNILRKEANGEETRYNWLNLLAPAIHEYFVQMEHWLLNPEGHPNLVLSIDSLTLKIEGLLRDICQFSGVATFYFTKDRRGRNIAREKDIHGLLYEEPVEKLFDEDDLLFLRFLLVEKAGYNLRHRIAHSLMRFDEYHVNYMHLLILALLKLGKYDFVKENSDPGGNG